MSGCDHHTLAPHRTASGGWYFTCVSCHEAVEPARPDPCPRCWPQHPYRPQHRIEVCWFPT